MSQLAIVAVGDRQEVLQTLAEQLTRSFGKDYAIELAASSREALELLARLRSNEIDIPLVISDDAISELLVQIHALYPQTLKVMLAARSSAEMVQQIVNTANLYRYLVKPWDELDLILTVKEALKSYDRERQLAEQNAACQQINVELEQLNTSLEQKVAERTAQAIAANTALQKESEARRQAEEELQLFFCQSLDGFFFMMLDEPVEWDDTVDKEKALDYIFARERIVKVNDAMWRQYGVSREQLLGLTPNDLFAHDLAYGRELWRRFFDAGRLHIETDERRFDGTQMWVEGDYICLYDDRGWIIGHFGIQRDISQRHQAESDLRQSQERYTIATTQSLVGIWDWNLETNEIYLSPNLKAMLGYEESEIPNQIEPWANLVHPDDRVAVMEAAQAHLDGLTPVYQMPHRMLHKDGSIRWILVRGVAFRDENGKPVRMAGTDTDITELKQAELALRESEAKYRALQECADDAIVVADVAGNLLEVNRKAETLFGYTKEELQRMHFTQLHPPEELARAIASFTAHAQQKQGGSLPDTLVLTKDGRKIPVDISCGFTEGGRKHLMQGIFRDISERKQAEAAMQQRVQLEQLVTSISTQFINLNADEIDSGIQRALQQMGEFIDVDRSYVYQMSEDGIYINNTHEWWAARIESGFSGVQTISLEACPWLKDKLQRFEILCIPQVAALPPEASRERAFWQSKSIQSILCFPLVSRDRLIGCVGFQSIRTSKTWTEASVNLLKLVGEILVSALERKRVEEALRLTQFAIDRAADAIFWVDSEARFLYFNEAACQLLGYSREQLLNMRVYDLDPDYPPEAWAKTWEALKAKGHLILESHLRNARGQTFPVEITANYLKFKGQEAQCTFVRDISERQAAWRDRQQAEEKIKQAQIFLDSIVENIPDMIFVKDAKDLRFVRFNKAGEELLGYPREVSIGKNDYDFFPKEQADFFTARDREVLESKSLLDIAEEPVQTKDKGVRILHTKKLPIVDAAGKPQYLLGISEDITDRQQAEEALRQSEAQNRAILEAIPDLMLRVKRDGTCLDMRLPKDPRAGYFVAIERHLSEVLSPELLQRQLQYIDLALTTGELQVYEHQLIKQGKITYEELRISASGPDEVLIVVRDITDRKLAEAKIQASLQEKEVLLKEIHHRVKNNLYIISSLLDWQADSTPDSHLLDVFTEIQNRIQTMVLIHEQLYQSEDLGQVDFGQYISRLVENLCFSYSQINNTVQPLIQVEPVQLNLETAIPCGLLINELVTNSLKHGFPKGESGEIYIQFYQSEDGLLHLSVRDNGIGIPADLNWQNSPSLGLKLVRILSQQLRAKVECDCTNGTIFTLTFQELKYRPRF
jgi:PAS domain S-box-containing protein